MPRKDYLELAGDGIYRIVLGLLYKVVLSTYVYQILLALSNTGTVVYSIKYMYLYTLYLFFDFAGYSLMAVGSSNILGIQTPMNFNKPFLSIDIKDSGLDGISPCQHGWEISYFQEFWCRLSERNGLRIDYTMQPMPIWSTCWLWDFGMELVLATSLMVFTMESWCLDLKFIKRKALFIRNIKIKLGTS